MFYRKAVRRELCDEARYLRGQGLDRLSDVGLHFILQFFEKSNYTNRGTLVPCSILFTSCTFCSWLQSNSQLEFDVLNKAVYIVPRSWPTTDEYGAISIALSASGMEAISTNESERRTSPVELDLKNFKKKLIGVQIQMSLQRSRARSTFIVQALIRHQQWVTEAASYHGTTAYTTSMPRRAK